MPRSDEYKRQGQGQHVQETGFSAGISGIAELICDKFTQKTCLVPHSDEFEGQVNFGSLHAVYVWKNIFALVPRGFLPELVEEKTKEEPGNTCIFSFCNTLTVSNLSSS